ncbi:hypothetical protein K3888_17475 [Dietzia aurantiaca]|uniref:hypothetical protein n=1 Tax=Dietzia aurantiaca TaxID=983873 RepID=UPI001E5409A1|nr:hypothetical protein [Dietzia aurantiaca]MCD2264479.1 hypothetical protein [Dietzia aurantiaca]
MTVILGRSITPPDAGSPEPGVSGVPEPREVPGAAWLVVSPESVAPESARAGVVVSPQIRDIRASARRWARL